MPTRTRSHGPGILLIVDDDQAAGPMVKQARGILKHWTDRPTPNLVVESLSGVLANPRHLADYALAWIWTRHAQPTSQAALFAAVEEAQMPALLTRDQQRDQQSDQPGVVYQHGMVTCPPQTDPPLACAMIQGLYSQSPVIAAMRDELEVLGHSQGGLAKRIDKIDEELRLASQLQRDFLPEQMPRLHGVDFHVLWRPAGYVSGDIYDAAQLDENHVGFFVADAVGHGVPAALLTMFIKRSLKAKVIDSQVPGGYRLAEPAEVLTRLNQDLLARQSTNARFVTACYGLINTNTRRVRLARAGHPYPLVLSEDEGRRFVQPEGGLLGVFDQAQFDQDTIDLQDHDRLVVYTDGFELAFPDEGFHCGKVDDLGHYTEQFEVLADGDVRSVLGQIEGKVDRQTGSLNQQDDLTVLCLDSGVREPSLAGKIDESQPLYAATA